MIQAIDLKGIGVAVVTPFEKNGVVDFPHLTAILENLLNNGVNYIVGLGTTAEAATLSSEERSRVIAHMMEVVNKRVPVVMGIGANNTEELIRRIKDCGAVASCDALLLVTPFYNKPSQEGLFQHYSAVAQSTSKPIVLYNVPGRTGVNMAAETTLRLANTYSHIIAVKEASGDLMQANTIINGKPKHFELISGDDALTLPFISIGAIGVTSVIANALPKEFTTLVNSALNQNLEEARKQQTLLFEMMQAIFEEGNPSGIKAVLAHLNLAHPYVRLPLVPASEKLQAKTQKLLEAIKKGQI